MDDLPLFQSLTWFILLSKFIRISYEVLNNKILSVNETKQIITLRGLIVKSESINSLKRIVGIGLPSKIPNCFKQSDLNFSDSM